MILRDNEYSQRETTGINSDWFDRISYPLWELINVYVELLPFVYRERPFA